MKDLCLASVQEGGFLSRTLSDSFTNTQALSAIGI